MKRTDSGSISSVRPSKRSSSLYQVPSRGAGVASGERPRSSTTAPARSAMDLFVAPNATDHPSERKACGRFRLDAPLT